MLNIDRICYVKIKNNCSYFATFFFHFRFNAYQLFHYSFSIYIPGKMINIRFLNFLYISIFYSIFYSNFNLADKVAKGCIKV